MLFEERDDGRVAFLPRDAQRRLTIGTTTMADSGGLKIVLRRLINISTISQQKPDHFDVPIFRRMRITGAVKWRHAFLCRKINVRAFV